MDPVRSILLALATHAKEARLRWHAGRAAVRARGDQPARSETFAYHVQAELCLITAIRAANLPTGFRVRDITLSRDPLAAARQLDNLVYGHDSNGPIEAKHEAARQAYRAAYAAPLDEREQRYADLLADLPAARRDKIIDTAEQHARHRPT